MIRNLKTLGLALVAALALSAVVASAASAAQAQFTADGITANEQVEIHGEQEGTDTFTIAGLPPMTCASVTETGFFEENGAHKKGPSAPAVTLTPAYSTCHIKLGILTRTVTVTHTDCTFTFKATKNTASTPFSADLTVNCPDDDEIEIHVYNTSNHNDTGAATLCTYDVGHETFNDQIELTNVANDPAPDDITADIHVTNIPVHATILSGTCGLNTNTTATYEGEHTLRATNEADGFVDSTVS